MFATIIVSFGIILFGVFSLYRDLFVDSYRLLELSILMSLNGLYYGFFYWIMILLGCELSRSRGRTLAIIRKWINMSIFNDLDCLGSLAEQINNSTVTISSTILEYDMSFMGEVITGSVKFLFILIQFDAVNRVVH